MRGSGRWVVALLTFFLLGAGYAAGITIDGDYTDWTHYEEYTSPVVHKLPGAEIMSLKVAWNDTHLLLFLTTENNQSWDVAYGFAIDVNVSSGWGYKYSSSGDAWGRKISFNASYPDLPDYELYFWWDHSSGITSDNFVKWTGSGWDYKSIADVGGSYAYTGNASVGLQTLEIAIPWSALGGKPVNNTIAVMAWIAGGDGSSAVKTIGPDASVSYFSYEWTDWDDFGVLRRDVVNLTAATELGQVKIDGKDNDWTAYTEFTSPTDLPGADATKLWVSWNDTYLFLFLFTNNTVSWDVAYGFAIDVNVSTENSTGVGWGYENSTNGDAWGRKIAFNASYPFLPDYELYFWWDHSKGITSDNLAKWTGSGWTGYNSLKDIGGSYAYTGNNVTGLQTLEIAIPWSALGGRPSDNEVAVVAWVAGGDGSSAVKVVGDDPTAYDNTDNEWTDWDNVGVLADQAVPLDSTTGVPFFGSAAVVLLLLGAALWFFRRG